MRDAHFIILPPAAKMGKSDHLSAGTIQLEMGSIRALACADWRPRRLELRMIQLPNDVLFLSPVVVGGGADHCARGRVRSPSELPVYGLEVDDVLTV